MPPLLADFIHIKVCKPNLRKTLDTTGSFNILLIFHGNLVCYLKCLTELFQLFPKLCKMIKVGIRLFYSVFPEIFQSIEI